MGDEPETATVRCPVLDVEVPEGLLAHDGEVGEAQHFLKRGKLYICHVAVMYIDLKHQGEERSQLPIHFVVAVLKEGGRKIILEQLPLQGRAFRLRCSR